MGSPPLAWSGVAGGAGPGSRRAVGPPVQLGRDLDRGSRGRSHPRDLAIQATSHAVDSGTRRYFYPACSCSCPPPASISGLTTTRSSSPWRPVEEFERRGGLRRLRPEVYSGETIAFD